MPGMMVAAGVDAARNLELEFADIALPLGISAKRCRDFLGNRESSGRWRGCNNRGRGRR